MTMKKPAKARQSDEGEKQVERVRRICLAMAGTWEKLSHGEPTFFVGKKVFAMCSINHHNDGHIAVTIPAAPGIQAMLIEASPEKFYRPPYVGVAGWVGIELPKVSDEELALHLSEAWRLIAPPKLLVGVKTGAGEYQVTHGTLSEKHSPAKPARKLRLKKAKPEKERNH